MSDERDRRDRNGDEDTKPVWGNQEEKARKDSERTIEEAQRREREKPERGPDESGDR